MLTQETHRKHQESTQWKLNLFVVPTFCSSWSSKSNFKCNKTVPLTGWQATAPSITTIVSVLKRTSSPSFKSFWLPSIDWHASGNTVPSTGASINNSPTLSPWHAVFTTTTATCLRLQVLLPLPMPILLPEKRPNNSVLCQEGIDRPNCVANAGRKEKAEGETEEVCLHHPAFASPNEKKRSTLQTNVNLEQTHLWTQQHCWRGVLSWLQDDLRGIHEAVQSHWTSHHQTNQTLCGEWNCHTRGGSSLCHLLAQWMLLVVQLLHCGDCENNFPRLLPPRHPCHHLMSRALLPFSNHCPWTSQSCIRFPSNQFTQSHQRLCGCSGQFACEDCDSIAQGGCQPGQLLQRAPPPRGHQRASCMWCTPKIHPLQCKPPRLDKWLHCTWPLKPARHPSTAAPWKVCGCRQCLLRNWTFAHATFSRPQAEDPAKSACNFFVSQCRIHVKCAFGRLVAKFQILQKPLCGAACATTRASSFAVSSSTIGASTNPIKLFHWKRMMMNLHWFHRRKTKRHCLTWTQPWRCTSWRRLTGEHSADHSTMLKGTKTTRGTTDVGTDSWKTWHFQKHMQLPQAFFFSPMSCPMGVTQHSFVLLVAIRWETHQPVVQLLNPFQQVTVLLELCLMLLPLTVQVFPLILLPQWFTLCLLQLIAFDLFTFEHVVCKLHQLDCVLFLSFCRCHRFRRQVRWGAFNCWNCCCWVNDCSIREFGQDCVNQLWILLQMQSQMVDIHLHITMRKEVRIVVSRFGELEMSIFAFRVCLLPHVSWLWLCVCSPFCWIWIESWFTDAGIILKEKVIMSCRMMAFECIRDSHSKEQILCCQTIIQQSPGGSVSNGTKIGFEVVVKECVWQLEGAIGCLLWHRCCRSTDVFLVAGFDDHSDELVFLHLSVSGDTWLSCKWANVLLSDIVPWNSPNSCGLSSGIDCDAVEVCLWTIQSLVAATGRQVENILDRRHWWVGCRVGCVGRDGLCDVIDRFNFNLNIDVVVVVVVVEFFLLCVIDSRLVQGKGCLLLLSLVVVLVLVLLWRHGVGLFLWIEQWMTLNHPTALTREVCCLLAKETACQSLNTVQLEVEVNIMCPFAWEWEQNWQVEAEPATISSNSKWGGHCGLHGWWWLGTPWSFPKKMMNCAEMIIVRLE